MRVLITGLEGFTGRYLRDELVGHGHEVVGLQADLTDAAALAAEVKRVQPDCVAHLAGIAFVGHGEANDFYRVNLMGTRNLLAALADCGKRPDCVLLASSANVYGNGTAGVLSEDAPLKPANDYAVSKAAMEHMARLWLDRLPIVIVRPFNYTGVGQSEMFLLPKIVALFKRRAGVIELGNLDVWRDFSDVRAVAEAYRRLLEAGPAGETVNVCSGRTHSLREALALCERLTGHVMAVRVNPAFVRANEVRSLCGDPSRLRALIGDWDTPPLQETLGWMLSEAVP
ncbi:GDP-mannose 4,6-dehydratase [uncultured Pigmentiphaga sp.]|jgi:Nucleoside-diphosphate-sugar epimerases|uniref:GDP-mannose 4,6-dehydratase n=1 Tax=uncultured Pigmentiphaga sp. TaxID=340361 RepID=UPI0026183521|nr:GDP-mannose 4,6-dehydratase [uncultured Pigmentiphaga sp.]